MHIPDAYLSPGTEMAAFAVMTPVWATALKRTARELSSRQAPLLSIGAAFCFAIQMFNIPAIGGTTAHALGATLLAILVGPWAAVLGMTLTLVIQALMFGDGGILSLGANCFDMAFVAPFVGFGIFRFIAGRAKVGSVRSLIGAGAGAYGGAVAASLAAGFLLGIQPGIAHDGMGHAFYCPFGLNIALPAMALTHLLVAGPAEAMITVAALAYLGQAFPELVSRRDKPRAGVSARLVSRLAWLLVLTPLGLLAGGSAWGEWDLGEIESMVGYAPAGIAHASSAASLLPDYGFRHGQGHFWEIAGYLVSAVIGCLAVALFTRTLIRRPRPDAVQSTALVAAGTELPSWMQRAEPAVRPAQARGAWFEATLTKMRTAIAQAIGAETLARAPGLMQSLHPTAKAIGFLSALVAVSISRSLLGLALLLGAACIGAVLSSVPLKSYGLRVLGTVLFFGFIVALPLSLKVVSGGTTLFAFGPLEFSAIGIRLAETILLRLAAGISLTMLWHLTTPWHQMLRSLRSLGVPQTVLTLSALTYRYLFVMVESLGEMVEARRARQVGACDKTQARAYAGAGAAVLFAKSMALTEEMHLAMLARGFDNQARPAKTRWRSIDSATALAGVSLLALVFLQGVFHV